MNLDNFKSYIVEVKTSKCCKCGKTIKNIFHYNGKEFGYDCYMQEIGTPIDKKNSKQKPLPSWAYELMNTYFEKEKDEYNSDSEIIYEDFVVNFFNEYISKEYEDHPLWSRVVELEGKKVPVYQQYMINDYLVMRLKQYNLDKELFK